MTFNEQNEANFEQHFAKLEHMALISDMPIILALGKIFLIRAFRDADNIQSKHSLTGYDITSLMINASILPEDKILVQKIEKMTLSKIDFSKEFTFIFFRLK